MNELRLSNWRSHTPIRSKFETYSKAYSFFHLIRETIEDEKRWVKTWKVSRDASQSVKHFVFFFFLLFLSSFPPSIRQEGRVKTRLPHGISPSPSDVLSIPTAFLSQLGQQSSAPLIFAYSPGNSDWQGHEIVRVFSPSLSKKSNTLCALLALWLG